MELYARVRRAVVVDKMSEREAARQFGLARETVRKMLRYSIPPGYRRQQPARRPKLDAWAGIIDQILEQDKAQAKKQRHTAKRIFERLRAEHGFTGGYTIVKDYVRLRKLSQRELFVPLAHPPGDAQADFGEAQVVIAGVERRAHYLVVDLPQSDDCFVMAFPAETTEAFLEGHNHAFAYFHGVPRTILYDNTKLAVAQILGDGTRSKTQAFSELQSHYLFAEKFGRPGKGNDKGKVEGLVGYARRNFLVPVPRCASWDELNVKLRDECMRRRARKLRGHQQIFDYGPSYDLFGKEQSKLEEGIAVIGSSNLTLSGISHNTELNVVVHGNSNHAELVRWFDELWNDSEDFDEALMQEIRQSWAMAPVRPYDVYMKTLYTLVRDRIEGDEDKDILWDDEIANRLATFQRVAVKQAIQMIRVNGGAFVSDVVGLGKSYIGAAIVKHFERTDHARPLILCPAPLVEMWERYNEVYQLNARVLSTGYLVENGDGGSNILLENVKYRERDFLLIDESHNFRYPDTQRYKIVEAFLASGRPACFLTATPRNKSAWDVYHQIKLFHPQDKTDLPIDPPNLREYFKLIEKAQRTLREVLANILIRRTRHHILRWYGFDSETQQPVDPANFNDYLDGKKKAYVLVGGRHQFFPKRELETVEYSIEETYQGLYQKLRGYIGRSGRGTVSATGKLPDELTYARYGLWHYVKKEKQKHEAYVSLQRAGKNLRGLMRILMFKRFESSVYAFQQTIGRMITMHEHFLKALEEGVVPAGEDAQAILYEPSAAEEQDLVDALRQVSGRYVLADFDSVGLKKHIEHDLNLLRKMLALVEPITPKQDAKLQKLKRVLNEMPLREGKQLIFTQYVDTASYLYENLNPGGKRSDIDVIFSGDKSKAKTVGRFAPKANPEYKFQSGESELTTVVATDVLAEGLNLQDCNKIVNYDLHWNPVRLIQRFGRIDRIGSDHEFVYGFNFLPEVGIERNLGLHQRLRNRIQEIHDTIGEDSKILDRTEQINEEAMYAIYDKKSLGPESLEYEDDEEFLDLNEAEEILRQLRSDDPAEFDRIANGTAALSSPPIPITALPATT